MKSRSPHHWLVDLAVMLLIILGAVYYFGGADSVRGLVGWYFGTGANVAKGIANGGDATTAGAGMAIAGFLAIAMLFILPIVIIVAALRLAFGRR